MPVPVRVRSKEVKRFRDNAVTGELRSSRRSKGRVLLPAAACRAAAAQPPPPACRLPQPTLSAAGDYVRLSATAVAIVDTPLFQRLRYLKQLGTAGENAAAAACRPLPASLAATVTGMPRCAVAPPAAAAEYVYPGATHTRFAHSLGVAHRAKACAACSFY